MIRVLVAVAVLCTGCDFILGLKSVPDATPIPTDAIDAPDAASSVRCNSMSMLADDFEDGDLTVLWPGQSPGASEVSGQVVLDPSSNIYPQISTLRYFDLREASLSAKIIDPLGFEPSDSISITLTSARPGGYALLMQRNGPMLSFKRVEATINYSLGDIAYDAANDVYWRISNLAGNTEFSTSPDGGTYVTKASYPNLGYVEFMTATIGTARGGAAPYMATVDDLNHGTPTGPACLISTLTDDFTGPTVGEQWARSAAIGGTLTQHDGVVDLGFIPNGTGQNVYFTPAAFYDFRGGQLVFDVAKMIDLSNGSGQYFTITLGTAYGEYVNFGGVNMMLTANESKPGVGATLHGAKPYDPINDRWFRFRDSGNTLYWETSPDNVTWNLLGSTNDFVDHLDRVDITVQIGGNTTAPGNLWIDAVDPP